MQTNSATVRLTQPVFHGQLRPEVKFATSFASFGLVSRNPAGPSTETPTWGRPLETGSPREVSRHHLDSTANVHTPILAPSVPDNAVVASSAAPQGLPTAPVYTPTNILLGDNLTDISSSAGPSRTPARTSLKSSHGPSTKDSEARKSKTQDPRFQEMICRRLKSTKIVTAPTQVETDNVGQHGAGETSAVRSAVEDGQTSAVHTPTTSPTVSRTIAQINHQWDMEYPKYRQPKMAVVDDESDGEEDSKPDGDENDEENDGDKKGQSRQNTPDNDDSDESDSGVY
jgi:hypothetical protein